MQEDQHARKHARAVAQKQVEVDYPAVEELLIGKDAVLVFIVGTAGDTHALAGGRKAFLALLRHELFYLEHLSENVGKYHRVDHDEL
ncbi:MAG: hypothetical protein IKS49_08145 [Actinomycetaceae bacterium]|nr:hypothetical protein [Actinomycetaceae bacterium]